MATLYAQGAGELSAVTWNTAANGTGTTETPTSADTLVSNSYTIDVDDTYTFVQVNNTGGGTFDLKDGAELTCTDEIGVLGAATGVGAVTFALTGTDSAILNANVRGGSISTSWGVSFTGTGTLTVNGEIRGGTFAGATATGADGLNQTGAGTLIVDNGTGTAVSGGTGAFARGVNSVDVAATITITGNLTGSSGSGANGLSCTGAATITITGNLTGGTASGLFASGAATITITGNLTGGTGSAASGLFASGAATITITGDLTAAAAAALSNTSASAVINVTGTLTASSTAAAITNTQVTASLILSGPFIVNAANGVNPVYSVRWQLPDNPAPTYYELRNASLTDGIRMYTANHPDLQDGQPVQADVKDGVTYGPSGEFVGEYEATLTPDPEVLAAAVWDHLLSDIETADSAGARLKELASTDAVGGIVAALGT